MAERLIEERWASVPARAMDSYMDTLRAMADYQARRVTEADRDGHPGVMFKKNYAALMWALSELSGVGEEVRTERMRFAKERDEAKMMRVKSALGRLANAEQVISELKAKNARLKAELHELRVGVKHA